MLIGLVMLTELSSKPVESINTMKAARRFKKVAERVRKKILAEPNGVHDFLVRIGYLNENREVNEAYK